MPETGAVYSAVYSNFSVYSRTGESRPQGQRRVDDAKPSEIGELPDIDYSDPRHEHDAPREEIYRELPFFDEFHVPAGRPDEVVSDGTTNVCKVVLRAVLRYTSMTLRICSSLSTR